MGAPHRIAMLAMVVSLSVSANLLTLLGVPYVADGGTIVAKLHPAGLLCWVAVATKFLFAGRHIHGLLTAVARQRMLLTFLCSVAACLVFEAVMTGAGNLVVLLDTYLPAGLLAVVMFDASSQQRDRLRLLLQLCLAGNALVALAESVAGSTLVPLNPDALTDGQRTIDFRPTALYDHPLTGAAMTLVGMFIAPAGDCVRGWRHGYLLLLALAMVAFGGRSAMAAGVLCLLGFGAAALWRRAKHRRVDLQTLAALPAGVATAGVVFFAAYYGGLGQRLGSHLYWDPSAQVRLNQWAVLGWLDQQQIVFGTRRQDLLALLEPMRLSSGVPIIENFWLLMFISLGLVGFPVFAVGFVALLIWCGRQARGRAWPAVAALLLTASASNSLGRKSTLLLVLVAATSSMRPAQLAMRLPIGFAGRGRDRAQRAAAAVARSGA